MTDIARERQALDSQGLEIISREDWEAVQKYTSDRTVDEPSKWFFLHISVTIDGGNTGLTEEDDMRDIERIGQERFSIGFPYNAAIFDTGRLYEGQPLTRRGAHTVNDEEVPGFPTSLNYAGRAIVLPQMVEDDVTEAQVDMCAKWAAAQIRSGLAREDSKWYGHRDFSPKSCPGDAGYARLPDIRNLTTFYVHNGLNPVPIPEIGANMQCITARPNGNGFDVAGVDKDNICWHWWVARLEDLKTAQAGENLGGYLKNVTACYDNAGADYVLFGQGKNNGMFMKRFTGGAWTPGWDAVLPGSFLHNLDV